MTRRDPLNLDTPRAKLIEAWRRSGRTRVRVRSTVTLDLPAEITQPP
jgi:hypothetical protein